MDYATIKELIELAEKEGLPISEVVLRVEIGETEQSREEIWQAMLENLGVMRESVATGRAGQIKSPSGLVGGDALKLRVNNTLIPGNFYREIIINALAVAEVNAGMGKIVAGPTAGSSGIIPAVVLALGEHLQLSDAQLTAGLFTAAGLGNVVAKRATLAGAAGGCQAECGVASAMAAGASVELCGGNPNMVGQAFALALKNLLGLACDPVAGLVEVPCVKRNGFAASHALTAAQMALAGIESIIPPDEVIEAMHQIGCLMPVSLKETALAGLAVTPTGLAIKERLNQ